MKDKGKSLAQIAEEAKAALAEKRKEVAEWIRWLKSPDGKRAVFAWTVGIVGLTSCLIAMQFGINAAPKPTVAAEPTPITFPCTPNDPSATWMRYQLEGPKLGEEDDRFVVASFFDPSPSGKSAVVGGTVFERNPGQKGYHSKYVAPGRGETVVNIKNSCPVLPLAPTPVPTLRP